MALVTLRLVRLRGGVRGFRHCATGRNCRLGTLLEAAKELRLENVPLYIFTEKEKENDIAMKLKEKENDIAVMEVKHDIAMKLKELEAKNDIAMVKAENTFACKLAKLKAGVSSLSQRVVFEWFLEDAIPVLERFFFTSRLSRR